MAVIEAATLPRQGTLISPSLTELCVVNPALAKQADTHRMVRAWSSGHLAVTPAAFACSIHGHFAQDGLPARPPVLVLRQEKC